MGPSDPAPPNLTAGRFGGKRILGEGRGPERRGAGEEPPGRRRASRKLGSIVQHPTALVPQARSHPAPLEIGFVSVPRSWPTAMRLRSFRILGPRGTRPSVGRAKLAPFCTIGHLLLQTSNFTLQTSPIYMSPPNTRRVAGICAKKWIAPPSRIAVSPCPDANKENLGAGPFLVLDCCTNKNRRSFRGAGIATGFRPHPADGRSEEVMVGRTVTAVPDGWL